MEDIQTWMIEKQHAWQVDFIGIAGNVASGVVKEIQWLYAIGNQNLAYRNIRLRTGFGIAGMVWKTARPQKAVDILSNVQKRLEYPIARIEKLVNIYAVPVMSNQEMVGVLLCGQRTNRQIENEVEIEQAAKELMRFIEGNEWFR